MAPGTGVLVHNDDGPCKRAEPPVVADLPALGVGRGATSPEAADQTITSRPGIPGERFNTVMSKGQTSPGAFGTFDNVPDQAFARQELAIRPDWKADVSMVQTYEVPDGPFIMLQESTVGSQQFGGSLILVAHRRSKF